MALKRVCDITGTDADVEVCDVTIAGQTIKLDLAPAGVDRLKEFFGPVVSVRHPLASPDAAAAGESAPPNTSEADDAGDGEDEAAAAPAESEEGGEAAAEAEPVAPAAAPSARSSRRGGRAVKPGRKKTVGRRVKAPVPGSAEIRDWARANGFEVGDRGAIPGRIRSAYTLAHE